MADSTSSSSSAGDVPARRVRGRGRGSEGATKTKPVKRKLVKQFQHNNSDSDSDIDDPQPTTSSGRGKRRRVISRKQPHTAPSTHAAPTSATPRPASARTLPANLTPSKFLPVIEEEEELSSMSEGPQWLPGRDDDSGSVGDWTDDEQMSEGVGESEEEEEEEEATHTPRPATLTPFIWSDGSDFIPDIHDFDTNIAGVTNEWPHGRDAQESDYFEAYFGPDVMQLIVSETNKYYAYMMEHADYTPQSRVHRWSDTNADEMYVFFALLLLMPHCKKHVVTDYWKADPMIPTPIFTRFMQRDRFLLLLRFLHFADNSNDRGGDDRLWKVRDVMQMVIDGFKKYFYPFQKVVIDESLVLFKGRLVFKQYIPSKRHRFGIKLFVLCDCETGTILDMIVYTGTDVDIPKNDPLGISGAVVKKMMGDYMGKGHVLYTDNWYTSPQLCEYLHGQQTGSCGTVRKNRKHMPKFQERMPRGSVELQKSGKVLAINWHDKRQVSMLTTLHHGHMVDTGKEDYRTQERIKKPDVVVDYNINMRLVDKSDCQLASLECVRKTSKWYHKLFYHIIDISMLNAYNMYLVKTGKRPKLREFSYNVVYQLLEKYGTVAPIARGRRQTVGPDRLLGKDYITRHHLEYLPYTLQGGRRSQRRCHVCMNTKKRGRERKMVTTICKACDVPLCVAPCFMEFHTMKEY